MSDEGWIPDEEWETIVRHVPIPSVDLVVLHDDGVVLGKRTNEPAKGEWFVPGGRIHKGERLEDAVHRIATEELGIEVEIVERLGAYEHIYDTAEVDSDSGKHYVPVGFTVESLTEEIREDEQHSSVRVFEELPEELHTYTAQYLWDSERVDY